MFNKVCSVLGCMLFVASASAVPIGTVGTYDTYLAESVLANSGSGTEEAWIESVLSGIAGSAIDITYSQLTGTDSEGGQWESVSGAGAIDGDYAFNFADLATPAYFLVKVGYKKNDNGKGGGTGTVASHFLYENNASLNWAFLNLSDFGEGVSLTNISVISHVGITGGTTSTTVPEPGSLALLGLGIFGLGLARRRSTH